jgi:multidrug efflux pump subunit AcrB
VSRITPNRFVAAERLMEYVRNVEGVNEVWSDYVPGKPIISLHLDYDALARYGVTVGEVSSAVKVAFNGKVVDTFDTIEETIIYRMELDGVDVRDPASLYSLAVTNKHGESILLLLFNSFLQPLMVLFMIPLGIVGVMAAFVLQGMVLSFAAMIGIAGLMAVIVNDALVMLDRMNLEKKLHSKRGHTLLHDRQIVECASVRLRPVVITTVTTCAGLFPAAYELGGSNDLITPMIMAMFWGVLVASFTTLLLLPCFYAMERDLMAKLNPGHARQTFEEVIMYN